MICVKPCLRVFTSRYLWVYGGRAETSLRRCVYGVRAGGRGEFDKHTYILP